MPLSRKARIANLAAAVSLVILIFLCLGWELWIAPLRPGGSSLALKALPLLAAVFGILRGRRYTHQWASMLSLPYFAEGVVRSTTDPMPASALAGLEIVLSLFLFTGCVAFARWTAPSRSQAPSAP
ncbi:MAG: DUF2069 domain-containing protein [Rhodocyclaceae bacterium]|nr:DUF2069 domain-containing protein [Rhodocyclaceae bacterium]